MSDTGRLDNNGQPSNTVGQSGDHGELQLCLSERKVYIQALQLWMRQAHMYQSIFTCFPYYMMTFQRLQNNGTNVPLLNNNYQFQGQQIPFQIPDPPPEAPETPPPADPVTPAEVISQRGGYEYGIPPLYKRLFAEFIDFILLFILKLIVTFIAVDVFNFIDLEKFDFYKLTEQFDDYKLAMALTSEILLLEVIYRLLVCVFEAFCLSRSIGRTGGATPGKALLGLRVVTASAIVPVEGRARETVLLYPGHPVNFFVALARSLLKNFLISLLFPLCIILFVFKFNRTGYDLVCGVIVVEENMFPPRRHAP